MARSYFSYSVVRSDPTNLTTGGDSILTTLKNVNWEVKKLDSSNNEVSTSIYTGITGNTTIAGAAGVTDWNGLIEFWADAGQYVIKVTDPSSRIANKNIYWDSVSGQTGGIPGSTITNETITTDQIKNAEVKTADLDSSAVETAKIADAAITTAKIDNSAVTSAKIGSGEVKEINIVASGVTTNKIDDSAITTAKIAPSGVTSSKIAPGTIAQSNIADGIYVPIGAIMPFAGSISTPPNGWLGCDGSAVTTSHPSLRQLLIDSGNPYGTSGSNPRLPDMRGRAPIAAGTGTGLTARTLGSTGGTETHSLAKSEMPRHNHSASDSGHSHVGRDLGHSHSIQTSGPASNGTANMLNDRDPRDFFEARSDLIYSGNANIQIDSGNANVSVGWSGGTGNASADSNGSAHENMQPFIAVNYIIRAL